MKSWMRRHSFLLALLSIAIATSPCLLVIIMRLLQRRPDATSDKEWRRVQVDPQMLTLVLTLIAVGATAMAGASAAALAGEAFRAYRLAALAIYLMGVLGLIFAIWAFARLYNAYLRQQGLLTGHATARFLSTPYGLLALSLALVCVQTTVLLIMLGAASFAPHG